MSDPNPTPSNYERQGGQATIREIYQQPRVWRVVREALRARSAEAQAFLAPLLSRRDLRIILTGAGSSAYIGQCLEPQLLGRLDRRVEAIATTDLVAGPGQYLQRDVPTLLVSFARSGSSPESLAAVDLAEQYVTDCHHLVITCNEAGELYRRLSARNNSLAVLLPEATHDRGFAMTSSFSSMLYAALLLLAPDAMPAAATERISNAGSKVLEQFDWSLRSLTEHRYVRTVYLGSGVFCGLAREAALKLLELTDGAIVALSNSSLGFRHGPKTFVTKETLIVAFVSSDPLARRYDLDLVRELQSDGIAARVLALSAPCDDLGGIESLLIGGMESASDVELCFPYLMWAQLYAFHMSLKLGLTPDNPNASGAVHRIVRGVTIYPSRR